MSALLVIDGTTYNIPLKIVNRKPAALYRFADRTQDGNLRSEVIGWYFNYDVQCGMSLQNVTDYAALFLKVTEPVESHAITSMPGAPSGYEAFTCYFADVKDELVKRRVSTDYFRNLSFSIICIGPSRTP